jgi:predicted PurR-regulated permease PerM
MSEKLRDEKQIFSTKTIIIIGIILLIILNFSSFLSLVKYIYGIISPLLIGAGIAFVMNIIATRYEKIYFPNSKNKILIKTRRAVSIILSILTIILAIYFFLNILIPQITQFVQLASSELPIIYENTVKWIMKHAENYPIIRERIGELDISGEAALNRVLELLNNWAFGSVSFIGIVFGKIVEILLAIVFSIYVLFDKEILQKNFQKITNAYLGKGKREKLHNILNTTEETFSNFFLGQFKEAVILGVLCTIGMLIFRFPYATTIGSVVGLTALIPMIGAYLGATVGFLLIFMVDLFQAILFLVFIIILQQIEGNFIYPKVVGNAIGLPGIWVFAGIIVGGGLMGIMGILLGVPLVATIYKLIDKSINKNMN